MLYSRKGTFSTLALVFVLLLWSGCGGGGGSSSSPTAPAGTTQAQGGQAAGGSDDPDEVIGLEKSTNGFDADTDELAPQLTVNSQVTWRYTVTNFGSGALSEIRVTDDKLDNVDCDFTALAAGESGTCNARGTVRTKGLYRNLGTVNAVYRITPTGLSTKVSATDPSHYFGVDEPPATEEEVIGLEKSTNGVDADSSAQAPRLTVGSQVTWRYTVTNLGSGALSSIRVTDDKVGSIQCGFADLGAGESRTCSAQGTVRTKGLYRNLGTVNAVYRITPTGLSTKVSATDPSHYFGVDEPPQTGSEGCGLGYWKNHLEDWPPTGYSPGQSVQSVFGASIAYPQIASSSLLDALQFGGGSGAEGGARLLVRHGVVALLNAAHPRVNNSRSRAAVVNAVDDALRSGERKRMLSVKSSLEAPNRGGCPLGG